MCLCGDVESLPPCASHQPKEGAFVDRGRGGSALDAAFSGPLIVKRWLAGKLDEAEALKAREIVAQWRERLYDLGWFMKCMNEYLARRANEEDCCKGRFWESRYKCQALMDKKALLQCMAYVDLNPVQAEMAANPEESDYTSIQQRSQALHHAAGARKKPSLMPLVGAHTIEADEEESVCRFRLMDYLELVDSMGRAVRDEKRGAISHQPVAVGALDKMKAFAETMGRKWVWGQRLVGCKRWL